MSTTLTQEQLDNLNYLLESALGGKTQEFIKNILFIADSDTEPYLLNQIALAVLNSPQIKSESYFFLMQDYFAMKIQEILPKLKLNAINDSLALAANQRFKSADADEKMSASDIKHFCHFENIIDQLSVSIGSSYERYKIIDTENAMKRLGSAIQKVYGSFVFFTPEDETPDLNGYKKQFFVFVQSFKKALDKLPDNPDLKEAKAVLAYLNQIALKVAVPDKKSVNLLSYPGENVHEGRQLQNPGLFRSESPIQRADSIKQDNKTFSPRKK